MKMVPGTEVEVCNSEGEWVDFLVQQWMRWGHAAIAERGKFVVALSGGNTPVPLYTALLRLKDFPWNKTHIFMADERYVPIADKESNFRLVQTLPATLHPVNTELADIRDAAVAYEREVRQFARFDVIFLGIGVDGHTASLFPGSAALEEQEKKVVSTETRISMTLPVIQQARQVAFLVRGAEKANIVRTVLLEAGGLPAQRVCALQKHVLFVLDKAAAAKMS